jgi:tellurite resistance protein TehA-like permease
MALAMVVVGGAIAVLAGLISYLCLYAFIVIRTSGSTPSRRA